MDRTGLGCLETIPQVMEQYRESRMPALICGEERLTFQDLIEDAKKIACCLRRSGIQKGDRVILSIRRSANYVRAWLGTLFAGAVQVTFHDGWPGQLIQTAVRECCPSLVIDESMAERFLACRIPPEEAVCISEMPDALSGSDPFQIVYTSGSTGKPKGVVNSHFSAVDRTLAKAAGKLPRYFVRNCERLLLDCSLGFVLSSYCICLCLLNGKTIVLQPGRSENTSVAGGLYPPISCRHHTSLPLALSAVQI